MKRGSLEKLKTRTNLSPISKGLQLRIFYFREVIKCQN